MDTKTCPRCGAAFEREAQRNRDWNRRKFCRPCGHAASGEAARRHPFLDAKACQLCAAPLAKRKGEDGQAWRKRQTCGHSCAARLRQARKRAEFAPPALETVS
jgi:hypothetical protein